MIEIRLNFAKKMELFNYPQKAAITATTKSVWKTFRLLLFVFNCL